MNYALVLGGGGITGIGWETGLIDGLVAEGVDLMAPADLVIGTSAGSVVGAQVASGIPTGDLVRRLLEPVGEGERAPDLGALMALFEATAGRTGPPSPA